MRSVQYRAEATSHIMGLIHMAEFFSDTFTQPATWIGASKRYRGLMARARSQQILVHRVTANSSERRPDDVIVEEPLEMRLDDVTINTTMRTPGHDFELAAGFCFTEGLLGRAHISEIRYCGTGSAVETEFNVVSISTNGNAPTPTPRLGTATSSCGICGTASLDLLTQRLEPLATYGPWDLAPLLNAQAAVYAGQGLFEVTGAVHAAAMISRVGMPSAIREDVGRHNAVDKVIGRLLLDGKLPARDSALFVSGRASFEIVQKAWAAGFTALVAVSAPTQLAVQTARAANMTLVAFVRGDGEATHANVYSPADHQHPNPAG